MDERIKNQWKGSRVCVTGGAGFIGSQLVRDLQDCGATVVVIDNCSTGKVSNLTGTYEFSGNNLLHDWGRLLKDVRGCDALFHLAAHADVRGGMDSPLRDMENVDSTLRVLEACVHGGVKEFYFASSATVYGNIESVAFESDPMRPISHYAASKMACEGYISAYRKLYGLNAGIFRIANVVGPRVTHGVLLDFIRRLRKDPARLDICGNGLQFKPYVHVSDCTRIMLDRGFASVRNITNKDTINVLGIARIICDELGIRPSIHTETQAEGWPGDVVQSFVGTSWPISGEFNSSKEAIAEAVRQLLKELS